MQAIKDNAKLDAQMPNSLLSHTDHLARTRQRAGLTGNGPTYLAQDNQRLDLPK